MELRKYQEKMLSAAMTALKSVKSVLVQAPTASGKTVTGCALAAAYGGVVRVIVHRNELVPQWLKTAELFGANLQVLTAQQWAADGGEANGEKGQLQIVDEAHHYADNTWHPLVSGWRGVTVGFTATPWRLDPLAGFDHIWDTLVLGPSKRDLIEEGSILPARVLAPRYGEVPSAESLERAGEVMSYRNMVLSQNALIAYGVSWWMREAKGLRTITFAANRKHAASIAVEAARRGIRTAGVFAETSPEERAAAMQALADGEIDMLLTCEVLTEGIDIPACEAVLIMRPTQSLRLYLQMVGRAIRLHGDKKYGLVLDAVGNFALYGHPDDDFLWTRFARETDTRFPRVCDYCGTVNAPDAEVCETCGADLLEQAPPSEQKPRIVCQQCGRTRPLGEVNCPYCAELDDSQFEKGGRRPRKITRRNIQWVLDEYSDDPRKPYIADIQALGANAEVWETVDGWLGRLVMREDAKPDALGWMYAANRENEIPVKGRNLRAGDDEPMVVMDAIATRIRRLIRVS